MLAPLSNAFCQSHAAVGFAESEVAAKRLQVQKVLAEFDPIYRAARWVVIAFVPTTKLPDTLKVQRTDTEIDPSEIEPAEEAAPDSGVMPASNGTPALAGGSPVKVA
jgi:hypothetical protein